MIFAVKPQVRRDVVSGLCRFAAGGTTFLSIAAGIGIAVFEDCWCKSARSCAACPTPGGDRQGHDGGSVQPQTSATRPMSSSPICCRQGRGRDHRRRKLMDAVTAVSGSGPAYIFHFIEALTVAAEKAGLPTDTAKLLAMQTVYGAPRWPPKAARIRVRLRKQVTSPNGNDSGGLGVLMGEDRLTKLLTEAVEQRACARSNWEIASASIALDQVDLGIAEAERRHHRSCWSLPI